jgi:hypothetical protein
MCCTNNAVIFRRQISSKCAKLDAVQTSGEQQLHIIAHKPSGRLASVGCAPNNVPLCRPHTFGCSCDINEWSLGSVKSIDFQCVLHFQAMNVCLIVIFLPCVSQRRPTTTYICTQFPLGRAQGIPVHGFQVGMHSTFPEKNNLKQNEREHIYIANAIVYDNFRELCASHLLLNLCPKSIPPGTSPPHEIFFPHFHRFISLTSIQTRILSKIMKEQILVPVI